ncbi:MAG: hypothetical protein ACFFEO_12340 [Candidatus Thorarchaeota archaeon]
MQKIHYVLYFCAGNTCRSPFAEAFSNWLKETEYQDDLKDVEFQSAGIYHYYKTAQPGTVNYLKSKGIDISGFITKKIDAPLLKNQDLILGFEQKHHINKIRRKFKNVKALNDKTFLLLEYAGEKENLEIVDPFDFNEKEYNEIMRRIEQGVIKVIRKIIKINKSFN